jgi:drug/metabolite transporter (DMT)-like permease
MKNQFEREEPNRTALVGEAAKTIMVSTFSKAEHFLFYRMVKADFLRVWLSMIVFIVCFFVFHKREYDFWYGLFMLGDLALSVFVGYLILQRDFDQILRYVIELDIAYAGDTRSTILRDKIQDLRIQFKVTVLCAWLVALVLFIIITPDRDHAWVFDEHFLHKLLHFCAGFCIMVFSTAVISYLTTDKMIKILNKIR